MKHSLLKSVALFPLLILAAVNAGGIEAPPSPKALVDHPVFDFSQGLAGTEVSHPFPIHNPGTAPLHILGVHTG